MPTLPIEFGFLRDRQSCQATISNSNMKVFFVFLNIPNAECIAFASIWFHSIIVVEEKINLTHTSKGEETTKRKQQQHPWRPVILQNQPRAPQMRGVLFKMSIQAKWGQTAPPQARIRGFPLFSASFFLSFFLFFQPQGCLGSRSSLVGVDRGRFEVLF